MGKAKKGTGAAPVKVTHGRQSSRIYAGRAGYKPGDHRRWVGAQWQGHGPHPRRADRVQDAPTHPWRTDRPPYGAGQPEGRGIRKAVAGRARCGWCRRPVGPTTAVRADGHGTLRFHAGCRRRLHRSERRRSVAEVRGQVAEVNAADAGRGPRWTVGDLAALALAARPADAGVSS